MCPITDHTNSFFLLLLHSSFDVTLSAFFLTPLPFPKTDVCLYSLLLRVRAWKQEKEMIIFPTLFIYFCLERKKNEKRAVKGENYYSVDTEKIARVRERE